MNEESHFINNLSHEFKTPVVSILGFAQLLKNGDLSEQKRNEYLDIIISECKRLSDLSANLLSLSKVESMSGLPDTVPCNISEQIRETILQLECRWEEKEIMFNLDLDDCTLPCNPELLKQVWINLIDNAVKFSFREGEISIRAGQTGGYFQFQVSDNGIGMDLPTQEKIFDRFYQGNTSHTSEGNGLGLALAKEIITLHHGTIRVESEPEKGSTFTVLLPAS